MIIGVPKEIRPGERRVALVPGVMSALARAELQVLVEQGAGSSAGFQDSEYEAQGARIVANRSQLFASAQLLAQVSGPGTDSDASRAHLELLRSEHVLVGFLNPLGAPEAMQKLAKQGATAFALELLPRISRAQSMDALSSMATIVGYKAVLLAAEALPKMFPMLMTAGGTVTPARVFIIGVGVAGLQAIATARRLGAVVQAYDVRPAVKDQVESLGARFVELALETESVETTGGYAREMDEEFYRRQRELMARVVAQNDVVITTAAVPGRKAPLLITSEMVQQMRPGSVIVDVAAESGGNCELTRPGETLVDHGVTILGPINLAATIPYHASQMYAKNVTSFLQNLVKKGAIHLNLEDPIIKQSMVTYRGEVVHQAVRELLGLPTMEPTAGERS